MDELDTALERMVRAEHGEADEDDNEPDADDLPGLYYPLDYVLQTWWEKKEHGILPEPGGLNAQDWRLVYHDWPLVSARYNRLSRALYPLDGARNNGIRLDVPDDAPDWRDILK